MGYIRAEYSGENLEKSINKRYVRGYSRRTNRHTSIYLLITTKKDLIASSMVKVDFSETSPLQLAQSSAMPTRTYRRF